MAWINPAHSKLFAGKQPYFGHDVESRYVPAPTGGWDAISPLSAMEPKYAVVLDNIVPRPGWVEFRGGYNAWVQGLGGPVETLMCYRPPGSQQRLFAAVTTNIWETTEYGIATLAVSGQANARWQYINFTPAGGSTYIYAVNGVNNPLLFDGSTWTNPAITGVTPATLINVNVHKRRIWFIQANTTKAWYLATDAIQGVASEFDLGALMNKGGNLIAMGTWTIDGGNGPDDLAVFITSRGQAIVYKGTDPSNPNAWALVGVFNLAPCLSNRCFGQMGSDLLLITLEGLLPASKALPFDPSGVRSVALTNRIQNAMLMAAQTGQNQFGWQVMTFPKQSLLILNVPIQENVSQVQFVMNSITGAWCRFTGWNANCFELLNDSLYFGDNDGNVNLAYAGALDLVTPIQSTLKCAFNAFDDPGRVKYMSMVRPMIVADGTLLPGLGVDIDFGDTALVSPVITLNPIGGIWDSGTWDSSLWGAGAITVTNWLSTGAIGTFLSIKMSINLGGATTGTDVVIDSVFDTGVFDTMIFDGNGQVISSGTGIPVLQINAFETIMEFGGAI